MLNLICIKILWFRLDITRTATEIPQDKLQNQVTVERKVFKILQENFFELQIKYVKEKEQIPDPSL